MFIVVQRVRSCAVAEGKQAFLQRKVMVEERR